MASPVFLAAPADVVGWDPVKRTLEQCEPENSPQPLKKAKIGHTDICFAFNPEYFFASCVLNSAKQTVGVPYWVSDPRFSSSTYVPFVEHKGNSVRSEREEAEVGEVQVEGTGVQIEQEASPVISEEDIVEATAIMAEVVDIPFYTAIFEEGSGCPAFDKIHPTMLRKLGASKSPIMEALIYCAFNGWGVEIVKMNGKNEWVTDPDFGLTCKNGVIAFKFSDFDLLSLCLERVNSKNKPTTDPGARIKALKRWFDGIPSVRDRNERFIATVKRTEQLSKVKDMIRRMLGIYQRRLVSSTKERKDGDPESQDDYSGSE